MILLCSILTGYSAMLFRMVINVYSVPFCKQFYFFILLGLVTKRLPQVSEETLDLGLLSNIKIQHIRTHEIE